MGQSPLVIYFANICWVLFVPVTVLGRISKMSQILPLSSRIHRLEGKPAMGADYYKTGFSTWLRRVHEFSLDSGQLWEKPSLFVSPGHCPWVWRGALPSMPHLWYNPGDQAGLGVDLASWVSIMTGWLTAASLYPCPHLCLAIRECFFPEH